VIHYLVDGYSLHYALAGEVDHCIPDSLIDSQAEEARMLDLAIDFVHHSLVVVEVLDRSQEAAEEARDRSQAEVVASLEEQRIETLHHCRHCHRMIGADLVCDYCWIVQHN